MTRHLMSVQRIEEHDTILISVSAGNYGSLNIAKLRALRIALHATAVERSSSTVILDLSAVESCGSGFLTCLDSCYRALHKAGRCLIVCGDRTGLIEIVNWTERLQYQPDLHSALKQSALLLT